MHVADGVEMDQGRNPGHHQRHRCRQSIEIHSKGDIDSAAVEPAKDDHSGPLTLGIAPEQDRQQEGSGDTGHRHDLGEQARQAHAEQHVDDCATERQQRYEEE